MHFYRIMLSHGDEMFTKITPPIFCMRFKNDDSEKLFKKSYCHFFCDENHCQSLIRCCCVHHVNNPICESFAKCRTDAQGQLDLMLFHIYVYIYIDMYSTSMSSNTTNTYAIVWRALYKTHRLNYISSQTRTRMQRQYTVI